MAASGGVWTKVKTGKNKGKRRFESNEQASKRVHRNFKAKLRRSK